MSTQRLELPWDEETFLALIARLISHSRHLQNHPPEHVPREDLAADEVLEVLRPYTKPAGPLEVRKVAYVEGRSNVIIKYPGTTDKVCSFVGSHMDVVPANPEDWKRDPFTLTREGDQLFGRGVTDCLGHVATVTTFFKQLAIARPALKRSVIAVFIANEESSEILGVGVDELYRRGELNELHNGPLYWVDSANFGPTLGTGGVVAWELTANGKLFHSGLPHKAINAMELAFEAVRYLQRRFHEDFKTTENETRYLFNVGSSMKPTQIKIPPGSLNQIPGQCTISGDIRLTPFYKIADAKAKVEQYLKELDVATLPTAGFGRFALPDENLKGTLSLRWLGEPLKGLAVNLNSPGFHILQNAVAAELGESKAFSLTGSLPIITDLQEAGFDVQVTGFGRMDAYHAHNEYGMLSEFAKGFSILCRVVRALEDQA